MREERGERREERGESFFDNFLISSSENSAYARCVRKKRLIDTDGAMTLSLTSLRVTPLSIIIFSEAAFSITNSIKNNTQYNNSLCNDIALRQWALK
jgi:hypothetical protein